MRYLDIALPTNKLLITSCWHIGNPSINEDGINLFLERAKTTPWVHLGDGIEAITPTDPRFSMGTHAMSVMAQADYFASLMSEAKNTCIGLSVGNHEWKLSAKIGNVTGMICKMAGIKYLSGAAYATMKVNGGVSTAFFAHGGGTMGFRAGEPERIKTNKKVRLRDILKPFDADLKAIGHFHTTVLAPPVFEDRLNHKFRPRCVKPGWCVATPSMFGNYGAEDEAELASDEAMPSYAEIQLYPPTRLGWVEIEFDDDGKVLCARDISECGRVREEVREDYI